MSYTFNTYLGETINLARSLVIKLNIQNKLINERLVVKGVHVSDDESSWKYHLNMHGEYHPNDTMMHVISSDTKTVIQFDKVTLLSHPATRAEYSRDGIYYKELVKKYPLQEILIHGITAPVPMNKIIAGKDFEILSQNDAFLALNETQLIPELQSWINRFTARWYNPDFAISDSYYPAAFVAILSMHIPMVLLNIRLEYSKTKYASQYHIWSHLANTYDLDEFRDVLTLKQSLWLYRNIDRIKSTVGQTATLDALLENLCKPAGVELLKLEFYQTATKLLETGTRDANFGYLDYFEDSMSEAVGGILTTRDVFESTRTKAINNSADLEQDVIAFEAAGKSSPTNHVPTGIIRAKENEQVSAMTIEKAQLRLDYWGYLATTNHWNPALTVLLPDETIGRLNSKDALILYIHALNMALGKDVPVIPTLSAKWIAPLAVPTFAQLRSLATPIVTDDDINYILESPIDVNSVYSGETLTTFINDIATKRFKNELFWESKSNPFTGSQIHDLCNGLWTNVEIELTEVPGTTFEEWLATITFDTAKLTPTSWLALSETLLTAATGIDPNSGEIGYIQGAVATIVDRLTSYSTMVTPYVTGAKAMAIEIPNLKLFESEGYREDSVDVEIGSYLIDRQFGLDEIATHGTSEVGPGHLPIDLDKLPPGLSLSSAAPTTVIFNSFIGSSFISTLKQVDIIDMDITPSDVTIFD